MNKKFSTQILILPFLLVSMAMGRVDSLMVEFDVALKDSNKYIQKFFNISSEKEFLYVKERSSIGNFLMFYSSDRKKCVAYITENNNGVPEVTNYAFGVFKNGRWSLSHEDSKTGEMFESNGGLATLRLIKRIMNIGKKDSSAIRIKWISGEEPRIEISH